MRVIRTGLFLAAPLSLMACSNMDDAPVAPVAPVGPGAIVGSVAADRDGNGVADGYYTTDGTYVAFQAPPCPQPVYTPAPAPATGERGI